MAVFRPLLRMFIVSGLMLSSGQAQDRRSVLGWQTFVVQDFGTSIQYPATIFAPVGKAEKGLGQRFERADGRAALSIYASSNEAGDTPASYVRRNLRMNRSALDYERITRSFFAICSEDCGSKLLQPVQLVGSRS